ncbi:MAG TPA: multiheme c-type cytochrome [Candidatus Sulfobium mesophilum]|nr:multiheme c-type cytochrome [Candidatus Sulfobium mesophilum]
MSEESAEKISGKGTLGLVIFGPILGLLYVCLLPLIALMTLMLALPELASAKKTDILENSSACMSCHSSQEFTKTFRNKEKMSVFVSAKDFKSSVHRFLSCSDCHMNISLESHPGSAAAYESKDAFAIKAALACRNCHSDAQLKAKPNHGFIANKTNAPPCTSCHGAHTVKRISEWKPALSSNNQYCLTCHSQKISKKQKNGEILSLSIDPSMLAASVHNKHNCSDCHTEYSKTSHPVKQFDSNRQHSVAVSAACNKCHADKYKAVSESIHYKLISEGNLKAPVCTDCHGFHAVGPKSTYETMSGVPCKKCHDDIFKIYSKSVHGVAKAKGQHNAPLCSSCHFAHDVKVSAMTEKVKGACLGCHKDAEAKHTKWLPNASLHLSAISCAACHSPGSGKGIYLKLYDQETGKAFTEEQMVKILGTTGEGLSQKIDPHGDGIESDELWRLVSRMNEKGTNAKVTFIGKMDVSNVSEAHQLSYKKNAVKECENCHSQESDFFKNVTVAVVKADGRLIRHKAKSEVLGSMFSLLTLKQFYVLGSTRLKGLDWLGIVMVFGGIAVPIAHITLRILTSPIREAKRMNGARKEGKR